jgi:predicted ATPase
MIVPYMAYGTTRPGVASIMAPTVSRGFHLQVLARAARSDCQAQPRNPETLPRDLSSFVGGSQQIDAVTTHLRTRRLVTLTGGAGVGKTRLALQVAHSVRADYACCSWTTLSSVVDGAHVASVVAATLGGGERVSSIGVDALVACIGDHDLLLVLDNCEHLISDCAELVLRLLQACGGVRILATSREPLGVPGEMVYPVAPLSLPNTDEPFEQQMLSESVQLFVERARSRSARFQLTRDSGGIAARICRTLNGIPLAIELAAARTSSMGVADIAERLDDLLGLLVVGARAAPPRQRSLRASIDWSHVLLQGPEQRLLRRLSVFEEEFVLQDAEAVCALEDTDVRQIAPVLERLVTQSLVQVAEKDSKARFWLIASVRQYARERLEQAGEVARMESRLRSSSDTTAAPDLPSAPSAERGILDERPQLAITDTPDAHGRRRSVLSERERAVVVLIAGGRSNREIADELVITKKTAEAHVSHILTKLGLFSRVQIATWSLQNDLALASAAAR